MANFADAIEPNLDSGGAISFQTRATVEEAGQSFVFGVPVQVNATDGGVQIWDGATLAAGIAGFSIQAAQNLGSTGAGSPAPFGPIISGGIVGTFVANPYQPSALIIPVMTPIADGFNYYAVAQPNTIFIGKIGTSSTVTPVATTNQQVGIAYGLTKDTGNNFWYVDTNKTGGSAAVRVVGLSPLEAVGTVGGHVLFVVLPAVAQIFS